MSNTTTHPLAQVVGETADTIDSLVHAMKLPMPATTHLEALRVTLPRIVETLRKVYVAETGENPWATHPGAAS
jgi:hypothetical protein